MLIEKCACRRTYLPILPCDCTACVWFIHDYNYNNCFWVLSEFLTEHPGTKFSIDEIAEMENVPAHEIAQLLENALKKIRTDGSKYLHAPD